MTRIRIVTVLLATAALAGCTKNGIQDILNGPTAGSNIKFYNFGLNAPGVNFYANDTKVTAISSTNGSESTTGTAYGKVGNAGLYSSLAPGAYTFTGRIAAAQDNGLAVSSLGATLADGKSYSLYQSGVYDPVAKKIDAFIVQDDYPAAIDLSVTSARFVNASSNASPMTLYAKNTVTHDSVAIGTTVAYKNGSAFVNLTPGIYDLTARYAGSNAAVIALAGVSFSGGRVYTVTAFGDMTVTSTAAANRPQLDVTANR